MTIAMRNGHPERFGKTRRISFCALVVKLADTTDLGSVAARHGGSSPPEGIYSMDIKIIDTPLPRSELVSIAKQWFDTMVKAVVDVDKEVMALGGEWHADAEAVLIGHGSNQQSLWGINIYPHDSRDQWIVFDSLINIRPTVGNRSMTVQDEVVKRKITHIVDMLIHD